MLQDLKRESEHADVIKELGRLYPNNTQVLHCMALKEFQAENYEAALKKLDLALKSDPNKVQTLMLRMNVLKKMKKLDDALAMADLILSIEEGHEVATLAKGAICVELQRHHTANLVYDKMIKQNPNHTEALLGKANVAALVGNYHIKSPEIFVMIMLY